MAYINGKKIITCMYAGKLMPIVVKFVEGEKNLSTLADVGRYYLFELKGKPLSKFKKR